MFTEYIKNPKYYFFSDKKFYKLLLTLALPIILQNFIASSLNFVDTIMIVGVGVTEIAAVGQANQIFFVMSLFLFGIGSGSSVLTAQFWGNKNHDGIKKVLGIGLIAALALSSVFTILALVMPEQLIGIFTKDILVIQKGTVYIRIVCVSYIFTAMTFVYSSVLRSTGHIRLPMYASVAALITNTFLNWVLIFGKLGAPALGVQGAAIATVIARLIEIAIIIYYTYKLKLPCAATIKELMHFSKQYVTKFVKISSPVILNEGLWGLGTTIYSVVYGNMGTPVYSAIVMEGTIDKFAFIIIMGIASASAIILGNEIGAGNNEKAFKYGVRLLVIAVVLGISVGALIFSLSGIIISAYNAEATVKNIAAGVLKIFAFFMVFKCFNYTSIIGIFRSGGDTRYSLMLDTLGVWGLGVPLAIISGLVLKTPVYWVFALANLEEVIKVFFCIYRFHSKKWIHNLNSHLDADEAIA